MKRAMTIKQDLAQIDTVEDLTQVFESIASIKIGKIRNRVVESKSFFGELWQAYNSLRLDAKEQLSRSNKHTNKRNVIMVVTAEGRLSGDSSRQVVESAAAAYEGFDKDKTDVVTLGSQGASMLERRGISVSRQFAMPESDIQFSVSDIIELVGEYERITVFYQTYESLRIQRTERIELVTAVQQLGDEVKKDKSAKEDIVSSHDYILEPNIQAIADYLESLMLGVALTQVIMESKLAQYAARFNSMNAAKHRAHDISKEFHASYSRAKRSESDERLKETIVAVRGIA